MNSNNDVLTLLSDLVKFESVTPDKSECQKYIENYLSNLDFKTEYIRYGDVSNMISTFGSKSPCLIFVGHTDVVPPGDLSQWKYNPYRLTQHEGMLIGRGSADMKGGIACFMTAIKEYLNSVREIDGSIKILLTGDEEGDAINGIRKIIDEKFFKKDDLDYCLVGEPSSSDEILSLIHI